MALGAARERLRVAHALPDLPLTCAAFRDGRLSYSKARAITRVVTPGNESVLVDIALGRESGLDLVRELAQEHPGLAILVLSMHDEMLYAKRTLRAGARGYIMKHEGTELLLHAIRTVLAGDIHVSARVNASLLRTLSARLSSASR